MKKIDIKLRQIKEEVLNCQKCPLYKTRTYPVIGEGFHEAEIMFCGEAPGFHEDKSGRPFCGAAGKVLNELLESIGVDRNRVYITNILKCRPPQNRAPQEEEVKKCSPYLNRQIAIIKPRIISTLGNHATKYIFQKYGLKEKIKGISKIRGQIFETQDLFQEIKIIPLYHPAVAVYNSSQKKVLERDFRILKKFI